jgi:hypothetical protein
MGRGIAGKPGAAPGPLVIAILSFDFDLEPTAKQVLNER